MVTRPKSPEYSLRPKILADAKLPTEGLSLNHQDNAATAGYAKERMGQVKEPGVKTEK